MVNNGMVSGFTFSLLMAIPPLISALLILAGVLFAVAKLRQYPRPAAWLALGLVLILVGRVSGVLGRLVLVRVFGPADVAVYFGFLSLVLSLVDISGLACMLVAVFVSRDPPAHAGPTDAEHMPSIDVGKEAPNSNPYSSPPSS